MEATEKRRLLLSFNQVEKHEPDVHAELYDWQDGLESREWKDLGENVTERVVLKIARWTMDVLGEASSQWERCHVLSLRVCREKGWICERQGYVKVLIGKNMRGEKVFEYAHRLVLWADWPGQYEPAMDLAMHGRNGKPCKLRRCVNPRHLEWGTSKDNKTEVLERRGWRV